jgi:hypothetical protein
MTNCIVLNFIYKHAAHFFHASSELTLLCLQIQYLNFTGKLQIWLVYNERTISEYSSNIYIRKFDNYMVP